MDPQIPSPLPDAALRAIDAYGLRARLGATARAWQIEIVEQTGSTNADLLARLRAQPEPGPPIVRAAYRQSAGRGRRGRAWLGAAGDSLLFSLGYSLPRPVHALGGLSLAVGTALLDGLRALPLREPRRLALKWPNDVLLDGAKLAGVLLETAWSRDDACAVVVGIGLNLRGADALHARFGDSPAGEAAATPPAALSSVLSAPAMTEVFASVLNALATTMQRFGERGFAPFRAAWNADHAYADRAVVLSESGARVAEGIALGADAAGQLLVATSDGVRTVTSLDVSLRAQPIAPRSASTNEGTA